MRIVRVAIVRAALGACACSSIACGGGAPSESSGGAEPTVVGKGADAAVSSASSSIADAGAASADASVPDASDEDAGKAHDAALDAPPDAPMLGFDCTGQDAGLPTDLACTGLYDSWPDKHVAPAARAFTPGAALWSDGAEKSRWIRLPPGTAIDTTDMNEWTFPVETKVWKEFRLNGARVETRFLWKRPTGWLATTYAWSRDGASAQRLASGALNVWGTTYEIPSENACVTCHQGRTDFVLGFEAVGLSLPGAQGLTMTKLVSEGLVSRAPASPITVPGDANARAALAWLHANCGNACHNRSSSSFAGDTGFFMRLDVERLASVRATDTYTTGVNVTSGFQVGGSSFVRIAPGDPSRSAIAYRIGTRDTQGEGYQMPPIDSHAVDTSDAAIVTAWIRALQ